MKKNAPHDLALLGFTLLEMSLVLVIIGVLGGSILVAKTIITNSKIQTIMTDVDNYTAAVGNFKQVYQALPGDYANATSQWSGTTNGNGDGMIGNVTGQEYEVFSFWQHLYDANMFTQSLSGTAGSAGVYDAVIGTNVPAGSITGSGYSVIYFGSVTSTSEGYCGGDDCYAGFYGHVFLFGQTSGSMTYGYGYGYGSQSNSTSPGLTYGPILTPAQAASIDSKMDDGMPATGKIRSYVSTSTLNPGCTTSAASTATYNTSGSVGNVNPQSLLCSLIFVTGF